MQLQVEPLAPPPGAGGVVAIYPASLVTSPPLEAHLDRGGVFRPCLYPQSPGKGRSCGK